MPKKASSQIQAVVEFVFLHYTCPASSSATFEPASCKLVWTGDVSACGRATLRKSAVEVQAIATPS